MVLYPLSYKGSLGLHDKIVSYRYGAIKQLKKGEEN